MKKLLILILIALILALSIFIVMNGLTIGKINILGINGIRDKNAQLDKQVEQASRLAEQDYKQAVNEVETNVEELQNKIQEYEDVMITTEGNETQASAVLQVYTIDKLRVELGNYATQEGITLKMDLYEGTQIEGEDYTYYNIKFTANGTYVGITDFISDIENDSILGFKIENFKMQPGSNTSDLQATFMCNDIAITGVSGTTPQTTQNSNNTNTNNTNTNSNSTTNNTNTANNTNNTNTSNTAN